MKRYQGIPAAAGVAWAPAAVARTVAGGKIPATLDEAVDACLEQVRALRDKAGADLGRDSAEIFSAYETLLTDPYLLDPVRELQRQGRPLRQALEEALEARAAVFLQAKNDYLRERAEDIRNIKTMLLRKLNGSMLEFSMPAGDAQVIVAAESLSPADTMALDKKRLAGIVTRYGGATSHVVILAKALGIPAVTGVEQAAEIPDGALLLVDGAAGQVTVEPDASVLDAARAVRAKQQAFEARLRALPAGDTFTADGQQVYVSVNAGGAGDLDGLDMASLHGVGLYRTEFLFVERETAPTLEEQQAAYRRMFDRLDGRELVVRTLDIGGDKTVPYLDLPREENPFLGCRGIRLCFRHEELMRRQFSALLRAADGRAFSVMFPMVNTAAEFKKARAIWREEAAKAAADGVAVSPDIRLGVMIETPAAMLCADTLAACVDFASIGTNDLTQYILAADRGNPQAGVALSVYSPAVVRAVAYIIRVFAGQGVKISVCGEAGSDTAFLPLMLGMGLRHVSVSPSAVARVRYSIFRTDCGAQAELLRRVLQMEDEAEIRAALADGAPDREVAT